MPEFQVEVIAKVEAAHMSGETQYTVQGRLAFAQDASADQTNEPQMFAMVVPEEFWRGLSLGQVLRFPLADPLHSV